MTIWELRLLPILQLGSSHRWQRCRLAVRRRYRSGLTTQPTKLGRTNQVRKIIFLVRAFKFRVFDCRLGGFMSCFESISRPSPQSHQDREALLGSASGSSSVRDVAYDRKTSKGGSCKRRRRSSNNDRRPDIRTVLIVTSVWHSQANCRRKRVEPKEPPMHVSQCLVYSPYMLTTWRSDSDGR